MLIGKTLNDLDTPFLWVDLDTMEKNIKSLSSTISNAGVYWRPHIKSIKVPAIAHKLINAGAIGIACAKLGEAEIMAVAGIKDILISNQVVGPQKVRRLIALQQYTRVMPCVDSLINACEISKEATQNGVQVQVLIEVNTGLDRCGVEPGKKVLELAKKISSLPSIKLIGLMTWEGGHIAKISDLDEKNRQSRLALGPFIESANMCRDEGLELSILSCGGTGTYMVSSLIPGCTEIQAGGGVFGCIAYRDWGVNLDFALHVRSTVISIPSENRAIVDAGRKSMNIEVAFPEPLNVNGVKVKALHAEHGILELANDHTPLMYGSKLDFIVGYADYTTNLYDKIYAVRNGFVKAVWDISARGKTT